MSTAFLVAVAMATFPLPPVVPPPAWVEPVEIPTTKVAPDGASRLLLSDTQLRVEKTVEQYEHQAWKVLSQTGVESLAKQEFEWDPAYEQFQLHGVWIWRDGTRRVAWNPEDARVIQRESSLDEGQYDGRLTLIIEVRDLREGDLVEIASTTRGENPVFQGRFAMRQFQSWGADTERSRFRLVWERPRTLQVVTHGGAPAPTVTEEGKAHAWRWDLTGLKAAHLETSMPPDVDPAPWVEFSDWEDWGEVARWADALFTLKAGGPRFEAELARFKKLPAGERTSAIVRFVQDDVRYVGVEIGEHSHRPHAPAWVLERGFGDCKDKSLLLVSLLRGAGVQAWPALVHASAGLRLPQLVPSPTVFNHAIVQVALGTGLRFIDPTMTLRRGDPAQMVQPRFHHALVVKPGVTALEPIALEVPAAPTWDVEQHWQVPSRAGKATLTVTTTARAQDAFLLRRQVKSNTQEQLMKDQRRSREEDLELKLTPLKVTWTDDEGAEVFVLREEYETTGFFVDDSHQFSTLSVSNDLKRLNEQQRTWPFALWYPLRAREVIRYDAPEGIDGADFDLVNKVVTHPAFELAVAQKVTGRTLTLEWEMRTLKDRVLPAEVASYRTQSAEAWDLLGYRVRWHEPVAASVDGAAENESSLPGILGLAIASLLTLMAVPVLSRMSKPRGANDGRASRFKANQKPVPGEFASNPARVASLEAGVKLFTSTACPRGHGWRVVDESDSVRVGDARVTVLSRRCWSCDAREDRYLTLD